jgi:hypothetical protein
MSLVTCTWCHATYDDRAPCLCHETPPIAQVFRERDRAREAARAAIVDASAARDEASRALAEEARWRRACIKAWEALSVGDPDSAAAILEAQIEH